MTEFYTNPFARLVIGDTSFVHRGDCEFDVTRQPEGSFMPWSFHAIIEGGYKGLGRKTPCCWRQEKKSVIAEIVRDGVGKLVWSFFNGPGGLLSFEMRITNESNEHWRNVFHNIHIFPSPRLFRGEKTFVENGGAIKEIRELWPEGVNASQGLYPFKGKDMTARFANTNWVVVPCSITAPFVYRIGGGNEPTPHARWCESRPIVVGMVCERINAVLSNFAWPCLDLEMNFGDIPPGGFSSQKGLIGIMEGAGKNFLACARDFIMENSGQ